MGNRLSQTCASGTLHCVTLYENQPLDIQSCQKRGCKKFLAADSYFLVASSARPIKKNYDNYKWGSVKIVFSDYKCLNNNYYL